MAGRATPEGWQDVFIEQLSRCGVVSTAAHRADISTQTAYRERDRNDAFREQWDSALTRSVDDLAATMLERAKFGHDEVIVQGGKIVTDADGRPVVRTRYDSTLQIFMLKKKRPGSYGDHVDDADAGDALELPAIEKPADVRKAIDLVRDAYNRGRITGKRMERLVGTLEDALKVMVGQELEEAGGGVGGRAMHDSNDRVVSGASIDGDKRK